MAPPSSLSLALNAAVQLLRSEPAMALVTNPPNRLGTIGVGRRLPSVP